jgi:hypothetical protein
MRSGHRESFREENASMRAPLPWIQAAEAVIDWYGAMFRLAFGLGLVNSNREPQSVVGARPSPPNERPESAAVAPLQSPPAARVELRRKRKKSNATAAGRSRSSRASSVKGKASSVKGSRRAA